MGILILGLTLLLRSGPVSGSLVVSMSGSIPIYSDEGSLTFFQIRSNGTQIAEKSFVGARIPFSFSFSLPPGNYELLSYVRPCDGNCRNLDPPVNECRGTFALKSKESLYAVRQQLTSSARPGRSCKLSFSSKPSPKG
jgi:hypothetical protein